MTEIQDLHERTIASGAFAEAEVGNGVLNGVSLLGNLSENGRRYTRSAMRDAAQLMSGVGVFLDHPPKGQKDEIRSVRDLAGRVRNPRFAEGRVRGDLEVLAAEPTRSFIEALATQAADIVGMSHRARGKVRVTDDGEQVVEEVTAVDSVDIVSEPATTDGLFEMVEEIQHDHLLDRGRAALEAVGLEESFIDEVPDGHLTEIGRPEDPSEREARAEQLVEVAGFGPTRRDRDRNRGSTGRPKLYERDPADDLDEGKEQYSGEHLGEVYDTLLGYKR